MLIYKIGSIPDLTLNKYQVFADSGIDGMIAAQAQLIKQLNRISLLGKISIHFMYDFDPSRQEGKKLNIFMFFSEMSQSDEYIVKLKNVIKATGISSYFAFEEVDESVFGEERYSKMAFMVKKERLLQTSLNNEEQYFYVVQNWEMNEEARLYGIMKMMQAFNEKCCYRVDLYSENDIEDNIHSSFERPLRYLRNISNKNVGISELSRIETEQRDPNADETLRQYEKWLKSIDENPVYKCRVCALSNDEYYSQLLLDSAITESVKTGTATIKTINGSFSVLEKIEDYTFDKINEEKLYHSEDAPKSLNKWPVTYTSTEIAPFVRFPILYDGENIELPKETSPKFDKNGIAIGKDNNEYVVKIDEKQLVKHMFVCGVPGSGKTNTMLLMANSFWNHTSINKDGEEINDPIPFLVLEPAKREYRELALFDIPELIIFSPSANTNFPLQLNPFEFPKNLTLSEHIGNLCQVFEGAFPIAPPAPFILDRAIQKIYENKGWSYKDINNGDKPYPVLSDLYAQFEKELEETDYDSEIRGNIKSVLEMRIGSLLKREKKEIFDVRKSSLSPEEWLEKPVIIELEALGEGPANFVTLLLCTLIRETLKANPNKDKEKPIRHVIFIEEAHNLISSESQTDDPQNSNPKIAATSYIVKMLAEVRALREGIIIADQLPTAMAPEVIKNTNIKLVHRLTSSDDRGLVGSTMSASPLQMENMATFTSGQALFTYEKLLRPFEMQVDLVPEHGENTPGDERLFKIMKNKPGYRAVREKIEFEKFEHIKEKAKFAADQEKELTLSIKNTDFTGMNKEEIKVFIREKRNGVNSLKALAKAFLYECEMINEDFFDRTRKETLMEIISGIGIPVERKLQNLANIIGE